MKLILFGTPGVGKGTQAKILAEKNQAAHISTGDMLRAEIKNESELGRLAKDFLDRGELVPDDVIIGMIEKVLDSENARGGFVFDGFPRTVPQAEALQQMLERRKSTTIRVVNLVVSEEEVVKRLSGRISCANCGAIYNRFTSPPKSEGKCDKCGSTDIRQRDDDKEETVRNRLSVYHKQTEPVLKFYRALNLVDDIGADRPVQEVTSMIEKTYTS
ncbi:MAG: adenylate kinase [Chloroherpetonaceae bacterium]|nr:adenylate kinase [Chloroherpetonaceae bacterium]